MLLVLCFSQIRFQLKKSHENPKRMEHSGKRKTISKKEHPNKLV